MNSQATGRFAKKASLPCITLIPGRQCGPRRRPLILWVLVIAVVSMVTLISLSALLPGNETGTEEMVMQATSLSTSLLLGNKISGEGIVTLTSPSALLPGSETRTEDPSSLLPSNTTRGEEMVMLALSSGLLPGNNTRSDEIDLSKVDPIFDPHVELSRMQNSSELNWGNAVHADVNFYSEFFNTSQICSCSVVQKELDKAISFRRTYRNYFSNDSEAILHVKVVGAKDVVDSYMPVIQKGFVSASPSFNLSKPGIKILSLANSDEEKVKSLSSGFDLLLCQGMPCDPVGNDNYSKIFQYNRGARVSRINDLRKNLWSKASFCRIIPTWLAYDISFPCWILPEQSNNLVAYAKKRPTGDNWIWKPWSGFGGNGITVAYGIDGLLRMIKSKKKKFVVQPLLADPLLINGRKLDLRVYVLVTSTDPVRAYIHERGLVRFASMPYNATFSTTKLSKAQFLTNTQVNKAASNATAADVTWPFPKFFEAIGPERARRSRLALDRAVSLALLAAEPKFLKGAGCDTANGACFHIFGFDLIFSRDDILPKVIEVNGAPSLAPAASNGPDDEYHYDHTKVAVVRDIARIVFGPITSEVEREARLLSHKVDEPSYAQYLLELVREQQAITEFRPCYPSPIAAVFDGADEAFKHLLEGNENKRVVLHNVLKLWDQRRLIQCHFDDRCSGGIKSVSDDLFGEGFRIAEGTSREFSSP